MTRSSIRWSAGSFLVVIRRNVHPRQLSAKRADTSPMLPTPTETARDLLAVAALCHAARQHAAGAWLTRLAAELLEGSPPPAPWPRSPGSARSATRTPRGCPAGPRTRPAGGGRSGGGS